MGVYEDIERIEERSKRSEEVEELKNMIEYIAKEYREAYKLACGMMELNKEVTQEHLDKLIEENESLKSHLDTEYMKIQAYENLVENIDNVVFVAQQSTLKNMIWYELRNFEKRNS